MPLNLIIKVFSSLRNKAFDNYSSFYNLFQLAYFYLSLNFNVIT